MMNQALLGQVAKNQMNMNPNKFRYSTSLAYHPIIHQNAGDNIHLTQHVLWVDLQRCLSFSGCNQWYPSPVGRPYRRLLAAQTTRLQGTTWIQRQINSNCLIFEPLTYAAACAITFWSVPTKRFFEKLAASRVEQPASYRKRRLRACMFMITLSRDV